MARHAVMTRQVCTLVPYEPRQKPNLLVSAEFVWHEEGILELSYGLRSRGEAGLNDIQMPATAVSPQRCDELWSNTCFEAFLAHPGQEKYWELNVAPSGNWNLYSLENYRNGLKPELGVLLPTISIHGGPKDFRCDVLLNLQPWFPGISCPEFSLAAVIKHADASYSYWAIRHTGQGPDFHDRRSFIQP